MCLFMCAAMILSFAGCSKGSKEGSTKGQSVHLFSLKVEIDEALKKYAASYSEKTGIPVTIESLGGGADWGATLKGYLAADTMPDIFVFEGKGDYEIWKDYMADLSAEAWVKDTDAAYVGDDGKVVGFPYAIEGYGLAYNKSMLDKAGIDPASLTNIDAYQKAFEKLDGMKDELGINAVISMGASVSGGLTWSTGNHNFNSYLSTGLKSTDSSIIDLLLQGKVDKARLDQYAEFVSLLFKYSDDYVLKSGSYDEQVALWAEGKTVFIHQGNWIDPSITGDYKIAFETGFAPLAFQKETTDGILASAPSWWSVYNKSKNQEAAKDFLNALATTADGAKCLVTDCGMISPFKSCTVEPTTPLASNVMKWVKAGKTYTWHFGEMPDGFGQDTLGPIYELLANGQIDAKGFSDQVEAAIAGIK